MDAPESVVATIDHLLTLDLERRGVIADLHQAATDRYGESPTRRAVRGLLDAVSPGDSVVIATGFPAGPTLVQETDGPVGAASLARGLALGLGAVPTIVTEARVRHTIESAAKAFGLSLENHAPEAPPDPKAVGCGIETFPTGDRGRSAAADRLLADLNPAALIAIERAGANRVGEYHKASGANITDDVAHLESLFDRAEGFTIGVGDGGNELGMGAIEDTVREVVPNAAECGCGCGGGIAAHAELDALVPAAVSNWGAHGVAAALGAALDVDLLHEPAMEERALVLNGYSGAVDAITGLADGSADGIAPDIHADVVGLLGAAVEESNVLTKTWRADQGS